MRVNAFGNGFVDQFRCLLDATKAKLNARLCSAIAETSRDVSYTVSTKQADETVRLDR